MEILYSAYVFINWDKYTTKHFDNNKQSKCALKCVLIKQAILFPGT